MEAWAYMGWKLQISHVWRQQRSLHPLLPRDGAHAIAFSNRSSGGQLYPPEQQGVTSPNKKHSSLATMKQPMSGIRRQDASSTYCFADKENGGVVEGCRDRRSSHNYINISLKSAVGGLTTIVPQTRRPLKAPRRQPSLMHDEWNLIFRSIHSAFPLMDNNPPRCPRFLDTEMSHSFHPETPIRIPRRRIRDAPLPHSPRVNLHGPRNSPGFRGDAALSPRGCGGFLISPWNNYMYESECRLTSLWEQQALHGRVLSRDRAPKKTPSTRKVVVGHIAKELSNAVEPPSWIVFSSEEEILYPAEPSIHYARCGNNSMIALEAATSADKWKHYSPRFRRYHYSAAPSGGMDNSFEDCSASPCHISGTRPEIRKVRARMVSDPLLTGTPAEELLAMTPTTHSIGLLAKDRSCNTAGRPTSRSARAIVGDDDVSNRSYRIPASIHYCCGCSNKRNGLYRMQHIPRSSCAKTSARKHGSTRRVVRDEYGPPGLFRSPPPLSGRALLFTRVRRKRTNWYSNITRVDFLANLRGELFRTAQLWT
uniref:Maturase K n=1 Tax=Selaginella erythropus TaxID=137146 RepID=A0A8K1SPB6_9TRAC|nr:maturase K [Selaginella erythropus]